MPSPARLQNSTDGTVVAEAECALRVTCTRNKYLYDLRVHLAVPGQAVCICGHNTGITTSVRQSSFFIYNGASASTEEAER